MLNSCAVGVPDHTLENHQTGDHQRRHIDNRNRVGRLQLPGQRWQADSDCVVKVEDQVDRTHEVECSDE